LEKSRINSNWISFNFSISFTQSKNNPFWKSIILISIIISN
jgi:hypothetical protein